MNEKPGVRIDIEKEMDVVSDSLGGSRVDAILGKPLPFETADYFFQRENIVAELKTLQKEQFAVMVSHLESLTQEWGSRGLIRLPRGSNIFQIDSLPESEQLRFYEKGEEQMNKVLTKANRQIKKTKEALNRPEAHGLLLLANDGNTFLEPQIAMFLLSRAMFNRDGTKNFSGIDRLIYFTANLPSVSGVGPNTMVWIAPRFGEHATHMDPFMDTLQRAWMTHFDKLQGKYSPVFHIDGKALVNVRIRDSKVPLNRTGNDPLPPKFVFPENLEQSLIDRLDTAVTLIRDQAIHVVELFRSVTTMEPDGSPPRFPRLEAICSGFQLVVTYAHVPLASMENKVLYGVAVGEAGASYPDETALQGPFFNIFCDAAVIDRLPTLLDDSARNSVVEVCRVEAQGTMSDPQELLRGSCFPAVYSDASLAIGVASTATGDRVTIRILARKRLDDTSEPAQQAR